MEVSLDTKLEQRFLAKFFFEYYTFQIAKVSLFITNIHCSPRSIKTKFINSWRDIENFDHVVAIQQIFFFFCKNVKSSNPTANLIPRPISLSSVISFHISHVAGLPTWRT